MSVEFSIQQHVNVDEVVRIAEEAGDLILSVYNGKESDWNVEKKSDESPLTEADRIANEHICNGLLKLAPHIPIVSEENKKVSYDIRKHYQLFWCVDPMDGTKEFLKRNGQFTVNIALIQGDTPILGVVQVPVTRKCYWSVKGQGAFVKQDGQVQQIHCAHFSKADPGLTLVASASHMSPDTDAFISGFKDPQFKQLGSSLKLLMVAEGAAHVYPRMAPTCEWDTAAAHAIVLEAGGSVIQAGKCDHKGKALEAWTEVVPQHLPVVYNKDDFLNPFFVVYGALQQ